MLVTCHALLREPRREPSPSAMKSQPHAGCSASQHLCQLLTIKRLPPDKGQDVAVTSTQSSKGRNNRLAVAHRGVWVL